MRVPAYVMGALATIALGIFGGYASIPFSFALWMARIAIIFYALGMCLFFCKMCNGNDWLLVRQDRSAQKSGIHHYL